MSTINFDYRMKMEIYPDNSISVSCATDEIALSRYEGLRLYQALHEKYKDEIEGITMEIVPGGYLRISQANALDTIVIDQSELLKFKNQINKLIPD